MEMQYVILGRPDCIEFAKAVRLAEFLKASLPNFSFKETIVPASEWNSVIRDHINQLVQVSNINIPTDREYPSPFISSYVGKYIGTVPDFKQHVEQFYGNNSAFLLSPETASQLAAENAAQFKRLEEHGKLLEAEKYKNKQKMTGELHLRQLGLALKFTILKELPLLASVKAAFHSYYGTVKVLEDLLRQKLKKRIWIAQFEAVFLSISIHQLSMDKVSRDVRDIYYDAIDLKDVLSLYLPKNFDVYSYYSILSLYGDWFDVAKGIESTLDKEEDWKPEALLPSVNRFIEVTREMYHLITSFYSQRVNEKKIVRQQLKALMGSHSGVMEYVAFSDRNTIVKDAMLDPVVDFSSDHMDVLKDAYYSVI